MDQSFSVKNFIEIFYSENRKGNYIENRFRQYKIKGTTPFSEVCSVSERIKKASDSIKEANKKNPDCNNSIHQKYLERLKECWKALKKEKYEKIQECLGEVTDAVNEESFPIRIIETDLSDDPAKPIYTTERKDAAVFFALKQVQKNIERAFTIKPADRYEIVHQLKNAISDRLPKCIIRTDIKDFFESIPHEQLLGKINKNPIINLRTKKILQDILQQYRKKVDRETGIPRGVSISSYLCELYMRDIDRDIRNLPNIIYYARYVDDIIAIFASNKPDKQCDSYHADITKRIEQEGLSINEEKTEKIAYPTALNNPSNFLFLGYQFSFDENHRLQIGITNKRINKYQDRISASIQQYNARFKYEAQRAQCLLLKRLKYLTGNTRLVNAKKNIMVGIYFSNALVNNHDFLYELDDYLAEAIKEIKRYDYPNRIKLKSKIGKLSFKKGFHEKIFYRFSAKELEEILAIYK